MWSLELVGFCLAMVKVRNIDKFLGPAHAVYFATYEAVKHVLGGNKAGVHHPLAAGMSHIAMSLE